MTTRERRKESFKLKMAQMKEEDKREMGVVIEEKWTTIESMKTRQIYDNLIKKRLKAKNCTPKRAHENVRKIQRNLKAKERDYWWRLTHKLIITKKREIK